jgi:chromosome segregation ATPase
VRNVAARTHAIRKQVAERDHTIEQTAEDLKTIRQQLSLVIAKAESEEAERASAEQRAQNLGVQLAAVTEQHAALEARLDERGRVVENMTRQLSSFEMQRDVDQRCIEDLNEQVADLTAESLEFRLAGEQLSNQIALMQTERLQLEARLKEDIQSAAKGLKLLLLAQENLSRVCDPAPVDSENGNSGHHTFQAASAGFDGESDFVGEPQSALLSQATASRQVP